MSDRKTSMQERTVAAKASELPLRPKRGVSQAGGGRSVGSPGTDTGYSEVGANARA